ncbi:MAG: fumarylacetoacetate hydrolase family protein [Saprospiraceae bacterium]|nr:fumarylacetoacetate hydrolase family protein [Saprospiraceae bacterium]
MKIFCIGRNYAEHAAELNNPLPQNPIVFMKPPTALLLDNKPFYHPTFSKEIHFELEVVLKIKKNGKQVLPEFADDYYDEIGLGIDFTARDLQDELKQKGHPWEIAKSFDHSAVLSPFFPLKNFDKNNIPFVLKVNGQVRQDGNTKNMIFPFNDLICYVSKYFTLQKGDLIYTGTPAGVGKIEIGDHLEGFLGNQKILECRIK